MKKSDYFDYEFIHPNGGKNINIKIPQSYVLWKTIKT